MNVSPVVIAIPIYFLLMGIELIALRFQKNPSYRLNDALTNINCGIVSQVTGVFLKIFSIGVYTWVYEKYRLFTIDNSLINLIVLFVLYDFLYYWAHRYSHEINLFWGGHVVHHSSEEYNLSVALRQSSTQTLWTFSFYLPLALVGFDPVSLVLISGFNLLYQFWIHTESIGKLGFLEKILNTPSHHRVHHGRNPQYIDKNHGGTFILFDKWFGTFEEEKEIPVYGITEPVRSWNPLYINLSHYLSMYEDLQRHPGLKNKLRILFGKPGSDTALQDKASSAKDSLLHEKYDSPLEAQYRAYLIVQYLFVVLLTAFFLFNLNRFETLDKAMAVIIIVWSTVNLGGILGSSQGIRISEMIRIFCLSGFVSFTLHFENTIAILCLLYTLTSLVAWMRLSTAKPNLTHVS
jgi:alkylglycerol monooxygenase